MDEKIAQKVRELQEQARKAPHKKIEVRLTSGGGSSLAKVLNTKEKADEFMRRLKALE
ncbi:hypothetical protein [Chitinophaga cymbidii]|uniref:Uncharacterized protein n=1 Tax=Chitinophaga cymbidii TaxID=1096750 RepID=A0A512RET5_9BACT|nr:hypothetical protein [Chitinophaga cymbidii]GEP94202.1 hypothetical protein CCY01nite_04620 [Chitinophaga cymbidii]